MSGIDFRVEKRGFLGWAFVSDPRTGDHLGFDDIIEARNWIRSKTRRNNDNDRRWKVVSECNFRDNNRQQPGQRPTFSIFCR
jgi:hypothetical protein